MLYDITDPNFLNLVQYENFRLEKDLENFLSEHLFELFESTPLLPIHQERKGQEEADIYALDESGNLVIFELKRNGVGTDAVLQVMRYAQQSFYWNYNELNRKFLAYPNKDALFKEMDLAEAHKNAFELETGLSPNQFNQHQKLIVIGCAGNEGLSDAVDYWKKQGVDIDFTPYRIYSIGDKKYFEFFAKPYDLHENRGTERGFLFDTNVSYIESAVWYMFNNKRVAAFGDTKRFVDYLAKGDTVFFSHKGKGIIAAAKVLSDRKDDEGEDAYYRDVAFLTPVPQSESDFKALSFSAVSKLLGKSFYWARTVKVPYLSKEDVNILLNALQQEYK